MLFEKWPAGQPTARVGSHFTAVEAAGETRGIARLILSSGGPDPAFVRVRIRQLSAALGSVFGGEKPEGKEDAENVCEAAP